MTHIPGYDAYKLRSSYDDAPSPTDGDIAEDHGTHETVAPCSRCGLPCAVVEHVFAAWSSDYDDETGRGGMHQIEVAQRDDEATTTSNPNDPPARWVCVVCAGFCDEADIVRPEVTRG